MAKVKDVTIGYQTGSSNTVYATWTFDKNHLDHYEVQWYYYTGDGTAFSGGSSNVTKKNSTYSFPSNAIKVGVKIKPVSKQTKKINVNGKTKTTTWWTGEWSTLVTISLSTIIPPATPPTPTVSINQYTLTMSVSNVDSSADTIEFYIVKDDTTVVYTVLVGVTTQSATFSYPVALGSRYKVCCRAWRGDLCSAFSEYSSNVETIPPSPDGILECRGINETDVYLEWTKVNNAIKYEIQYTDKSSNFGSSPENCTSVYTEENSGLSHKEILGLESDKQYFFRVRAINSVGESGWTTVATTWINTIPTAPTTWASTTKCVIGEKVTLHWVHNTSSGHEVEWSKLEITIRNAGGSSSVIGPNIITTARGELEYEIDTSESSNYINGSVIEWRVKTTNSLNMDDESKYSPYSVLRKITLVSPPSLDITMTDKNGSYVETLTSFPFYVSDVTNRTDEKIVGYYLSVVSNETYETVDQIGNTKLVKKNDEVYSKYFNTSERLMVEFSPSNIDLENNVNYTVNCTITVSNGLSTKKALNFTVAWADVTYDLDAEMGYDESTCTMTIRPYCMDEDENLIEGVSLSIYRREFDGAFTEIITNVDNLSNVAIEDPHPSLDYARYRIVGIDNSTGAVSYYDPPGVPIGETSAIIQWDEKWSTFDASEDDVVGQVPWSGSLLKLKYNLDVSDKYDGDKSLVSYIGRKRPVSYYGTQLGESSTWTVDVPKDDEETLYALRRLAIWTGDVYVREPSGSGYWASINVSFSKKHCETIMPVTLDIVRVEGGV